MGTVPALQCFLPICQSVPVLPVPLCVLSFLPIPQTAVIRVSSFTRDHENFCHQQVLYFLAATNESCFSHLVWHSLCTSYRFRFTLVSVKCIVNSTNTGEGSERLCVMMWFGTYLRCSCGNQMQDGCSEESDGLDSWGTGKTWSAKIHDKIIRELKAGCAYITHSDLAGSGSLNRACMQRGFMTCRQRGDDQVRGRPEATSNRHRQTAERQ